MEYSVFHQNLLFQKKEGHTLAHPSRLCIIQIQQLFFPLGKKWIFGGNGIFYQVLGPFRLVPGKKSIWISIIHTLEGYVRVCPF